MKPLAELIAVAAGRQPADLLLRNARIVDVFTGCLRPAEIAVARGYIVGFGAGRARQSVDLAGRVVAPGFIDAHMHIESTLASIDALAPTLLTHGTTAIVADPHEIANVHGAEGIRYMLRASADQPLQVFFTLPSCVPATDLETSGGRLDADDLEPFLREPRIRALAEMMNYPGVVNADGDVLRKIEAALRWEKPIDGHAPGLAGGDLFAYSAAGIASDHECTSASEALAKLQAGMHIMIREGTAARNLEALLPIVNARTAHRLMWCTDDRHPQELLEEGHIDHLLRKAIRSGCDPITAIQMATLNPARYFGLHTLGAIAPGRRADLVVFGELQQPVVEDVYLAGQRVVCEGAFCAAGGDAQVAPLPPSMWVTAESVDLGIHAAGSRIRVIDIVSDQIVTGHGQAEARVQDGRVVADPSRDLLKLVVVERHTGSGNVGRAFVRGIGIRRGALGSSVAHDAHNIIIAGTSDADMHAVLRAIVAMGGGMALAWGGRVRERLPLPIAGLMSDQPLDAIRTRLQRLVSAARQLGSPLKDPFMALSFLALPVIPELKLTDKGLVDVRRFQVVPLFV
jgi:adenine deaminase